MPDMRPAITEALLAVLVCLVVGANGERALFCSCETRFVVVTSDTTPCRLPQAPRPPPSTALPPTVACGSTPHPTTQQQT